jgi:hypothetical protein
MARLPNSDRAIIDPRKITDYLLCATHEQGGPKAQFFISFGWSQEAPGELVDDLYRHALASEVVRSYPAPHGQKFEIVGPISTPDGSVVVVKSVWIVLFGEDAPRLVTALPA